MKKIISRGSVFLFLLVLGIGTTFAQDEGANLLKGSDKPLFVRTVGAEACMVFTKYVMKTTQPGSEGFDVAVFARSAGADAKGACDATGKQLINVKDSDNNSFSGILGRFLFIDSGTSAGERDLGIHDVDAGKLMVNVSYTGDVSIVDGRYLMYDASSEKAGLISTCKDAAKWKRQGGGVAWVQSIRLDLQTLRSITVGALKCIYQE